MFKVAFPGATEEEESREMDWVRQLHYVSVTDKYRYATPSTLETPMAVGTVMPSGSRGSGKSRSNDGRDVHC